MDKTCCAVFWAFSILHMKTHRRSSSYCGKRAFSAVFVEGKWTPPARTSTALQSSMFGICFSPTLLPSERFQGLVLNWDGRAALLFCVQALFWFFFFSFFFPSSLSSFVFVLVSRK